MSVCVSVTKNNYFEAERRRREVSSPLGVSDFGLVLMMMMITIIGKNNPKCVSVWATVRGIFIVSNSKFYVLASLSTSLQFIQEHIFLYAPFTAFFQAEI